jgi:hypothetical protein
LAPPPREAEATRVYRVYYEAQVRDQDPDAVVTVHGVEWQVKAKVRRLASTGKDVIDLHWSIRYTGQRQPLIILEPSLTNPSAWETYVTFYAFPEGAEHGRRINICSPPPPPPMLSPIAPWRSRDWFLTVQKRETATGRATVSVADLRKSLVEMYPAEFTGRSPPKLYAEFVHSPVDRGDDYNFDAWTDTLKSPVLEIPDPKTW